MFTKTCKVQTSNFLHTFYGVFWENWRLVMSERYKSGDIKSIKSLTKFNNVEEYKEYIDSFIYQYKHQISPTAYLIVKTIKHMTDFGIGVYTWTRKWMAGKIERSIRMISKAIKELREIGFLSDVGEQTYHENDRRLGHNIWIVERVTLSKKQEFTPQCTPESSPLTEAEIPCGSKVEQGNEDTQCSLGNTPSKEVYSNTVTTLQVQYVNKYVPNEFYEKCKPFFQVELINDFWDTIVYTSSKFAFGKKWDSLLFYENDQIFTIGMEAIDQLIKKAHGKKIKKDMGSYLYGTVKRISKKLGKKIDILDKRIKDMDELGVW